MKTHVWLILPAVGLLLAGCGEAPNAHFSYSPRTDELMPTTEAAVKEAVVEHFGTPDNLVAWQMLPIHYGRIEGEVADASQPGANQFSARLAVGEGGLPRDGLAMVGLDWLSGKYAAVDAPFHVLQYQSSEAKPSDGSLSINVNLEEPVEAGAKFALVGHGLQQGRRLYAEHCMHCHGISGDGHGPTAQYLNPRPRDYRLGIFKFTSTGSQDRATRDDLKRIVQHGIPGTYMPSFLLLEDDELDAIIEYVRWLAMRGEFEKRLVDNLYSDYSETAFAERVEGGETAAEIREELDEVLAEEFADMVLSSGEGLERLWTRAEESGSIVVPKTPRVEPTPESIARGRELYLSDKTKCVSCHGLAGRGDGPQTESFQKKPTGGEYDEPGLFDAWDNPIQPRNLTKGVYRGGRRPLDLYRRIHAGIKGTPMPAFNTALKEEEIWDIVNYVMSVPYENGRAKPESKGSHVAVTGK